MRTPSPGACQKGYFLFYNANMLHGRRTTNLFRPQLTPTPLQKKLQAVKPIIIFLKKRPPPPPEYQVATAEAVGMFMRVVISSALGLMVDLFC